MKQYLTMILLIAAVAVCGFVLPSELMKWQDEKRLEHSESREAEEVVLEAGTDLTMIEKLQLMQKSTVTALEMEQGKHYSHETILEKAEKELQKLEALGLIDLESQEKYWVIFQIQFFVDTEDGTKSMILWTLSVTTDNFYLVISMDDETGKILSLYQMDFADAPGQKTGKPEIESDDSAELYEAAEKWAEYLEVTLAEVYDTPNPTANINKAQEGEIDELVEQGMSKESANEKVLEEWRIAEEGGHWLYGVYEDETGIAAYLFQKNIGQTIFRALPV